MFNTHCICYRLSLAFVDTGDGFEFNRSVEETLIKLWKSPKSTSERLHISITVALNSKDFESLIENEKKNFIKLLTKTSKTRWLSLHAEVDADLKHYKCLISTLKAMWKDKTSFPRVSGLPKKVSNYKFLGPLYLLKIYLKSGGSLKVGKTLRIGSRVFPIILSLIKLY